LQIWYGRPFESRSYDETVKQLGRNRNKKLKDEKILFESHLLSEAESALEEQEKDLQKTFMDDIEEQKESGDKWTLLTQKDDRGKTKWDNTFINRLDQCKYSMSFNDGLFYILYLHHFFLSLLLVVASCLLTGCFLVGYWLLVAFWLLTGCFLVAFWLITGSFLVDYWFLPGTTLVASWLIASSFLVDYWLLPGWSWLLPGWLLVGYWLLPGWLLVGYWLVTG